MKQCTTCGAQLNDDAAFCPSCGSAQPTDGAQAQAGAADTTQQADAAAQAGAAPQPGAAPQGAPVGYQAYPGYQQPIYNQYDHTAEFTAADISDNKVISMCVYLLGLVGVVIAMLGAGSSPYVSFNVRQCLKLTVIEILLGICAAVLCFTLIVPLAAGICAVILFVVRIICFVYICQGKAIEAPIVRSFGFLR